MVEKNNKNGGSKFLAKVKLDKKLWESLHERATIEEYICNLMEDASPARTAFQRAHDMIVKGGKETFREAKEKLIKYQFFSEPPAEIDGSPSKDAVFGLEKPLMQLVEHIKGAAYGYSFGKRVLLLHGPVGSAKSTIARLIKRGMERDSLESPIYTFEWKDMDSIKVNGMPLVDGTCPLNEEPLKLVDLQDKSAVVQLINNENKGKLPYNITIDGDLCPYCRQAYKALMDHYRGDWQKAMDQHVRVKRLILSEADRKGVGTFVPKDEKNQDSTELTGSIDFRKIAFFGAESDARAFNFSGGELFVANRGIIEFIEILKLEVAFLYDLLGASQEHQVKPKNFQLTYIDEIILGHTNEAEFNKLRNDEFMEALRDRTKVIHIPYVLKLDEEVKIYKKDYNKGTVPKHIAPHTTKIGAMWALLSRLESPKQQASGGLDLVQKMKLYNGQEIPGYTEDTVKILKEASVREGLDGISPRMIQDGLAQAIVSEENEKCVNPFLLMKKLKDNLKNSALINSDDKKVEYAALMEIVEQEYARVVQTEVQRAIAADDGELRELYHKYVTNVDAWHNHGKVSDALTKREVDPDEKFMRDIEKKLGVADAQKQTFRQEVLTFIASQTVKGKTEQLTYKSNERLREALESYLFEKKKDTINLAAIVNETPNKEEQAKIDIVKARLIRDFGYCDVCANEVLTYVASIWARGGTDSNKINKDLMRK